jgi:hypothetical protein
MTTSKERAMQIAIDFNAAYPPHQRHSATSRASALAAAPKFSERMLSLLAMIAMRRDVGVTDEEGQANMELDGNSYRPMRVTLYKHGYIEDSGVTRKTKSGRSAVVWRVTESGINKVEENIR